MGMCCGSMLWECAQEECCGKRVVGVCRGSVLW